MHLPVDVADYVDFYSSEHHATNVGRIFRPDRGADPELEAPADRLPRPGRHGRRLRHAGGPPARAAQGPGRRRPDVRPVAAARHRGRGRLRRRHAVHARHAGAAADFARARLRRRAGQRLVGPGHPVVGVRAARAVPRQVVPTSVSPWVVPLAALEPARVARRRGTRRCCPTSTTARPRGLDIRSRSRLNGSVLPAAVRRAVLDRRPAAGPHDGNGASLRTGDLFASGTVSGPSRPARLAAGAVLGRHGSPSPSRTGDPYVPGGRRRGLITATHQARRLPDRLGEVTGRVEPAHERRPHCPHLTRIPHCSQRA